MRITILGGGFVGVTSAIVFAEQGHDVTLVEIDAARGAKLQEGIVPFHEPGTPEAWAAQSIHVVDSLSAAPPAELIFICVGTPSNQDGSCDTQFIAMAAKSIAGHCAGHGSVVVVKSTVPPGTTRNQVMPHLENLGTLGTDYGVAMNPEFLREGCALQDARNPDRVVYGCADGLARKRLGELYGAESCPVVETSLETAEMVKYVSNAFLATKISFANEMANLSEKVGVNVDEVMDAVGMDARIGRAFLNAGPGYGGSCFPKDVAALRAHATGVGVPLRILDAVEEVNEHQPLRAVDLLESQLGSISGKRIALLGVAFKADTSDVRSTRALPIYDALIAAGATVVCHDPEAQEEFHAMRADASFAATVPDVLAGADAAILHTDWPDYKNIDSLMNGMLLVDTRRMTVKRNGPNRVALGVA